MDEAIVKYYYMSEEQKKLIDNIMATAEPLLASADFFITMGGDDEYCCYLDGCDEKRLCIVDCVVEIVGKDEGYYLVSGEYSYAVPETYNQTFDEIVAPYYEMEISRYY